MSKKAVFWVFLLIWTLFPCFSSQVRAEVGGATSLVKNVLDRAMEIQTDPALEGDAHRQERARLIRQLMAENFLSETMARNALGNHWDSASLQQRNEFRDLFIVLFQDSYTRMVLNFLVQENIEYGRESQVGDVTRVQTAIMRVSEHIPVDYSLTQREGRWFIVDVEIDGVSIVDNYRNSFSRVIRGGSLNDLLERMRAQKRALMTDSA